MSNLRAALFLAFAFGCASARPSSRPFTADEAASHVGESVTVEFTVAQVGHSRSDSTFLNSRRYQRGSEPGFSGFIPKDAKAAFESAFGGDLKAALEGKTVQVTGRIKDYKGNPEMVLDRPDQLVVVR